MAFPTIGSLSQNTHFSLLYHLYHFDTVDQRHLYNNIWVLLQILINVFVYSLLSVFFCGYSFFFTKTNFPKKGLTFGSEGRFKQQSHPLYQDMSCMSAEVATYLQAPFVAPLMPLRLICYQRSCLHSDRETVLTPPAIPPAACNIT
jgi:hypothetical protein